MDLLPHFAPDRDSRVSLTEQLVAAYTRAVETGALAPGDLLPASRKLAEALGVSRSVVVVAYERLAGDGIVDSVQGSGTRVSPRAALAAAAGSGSSAGAAPRPGPIDLRSGLPFVGAEPPRAWPAALARAARAPWRSQAIEQAGHPALKAQLARHARMHRGLACGPDDLLAVTGTSEALVITALALQRHHRRPARIAVENPGYVEGAGALAAAGATLVPCPVASGGATAAGLAALFASSPFDAVMLTPSHQFPLGGAIPALERAAILAWAASHDVVIIEDDYDSEFRHEGAPLPALAAESTEAAVIYVASLNKMLSPSLRCGTLGLPLGSGHRELRAALVSARAALGSSVSAPVQLALADFMGSGALARAVARSAREYAHRRALVLAALDAAGVSASATDGGLHLVIELPSAARAELAASALRERGVLVETLALFASGDGAGPAGAGAPLAGLVVGYGAEPVPRLMAGVHQIVGVLGGA